MLDTISLTIKLNNRTGECHEEEIFYQINLLLTNLRYCDILRVNPNEKSICVKLSYPRYFYANNAYLIKSVKECLTVNFNFINDLRNGIQLYEQQTYGSTNNLLSWFDSNVSINLTRVDIAFTYLMQEIETFNGYKNIYKILDKVYRYFNQKAIPKQFSVIETNSVETLIFANGPKYKDANEKVIIYNQYQKFHDYYAEAYPEIFYNTIENFPELQRRMRIEHSKRIRRKEFTPYEFGQLNILNDYLVQYCDYTLNNLFNMVVIDSIYRQQIELIKQLLQTEKSYNNFNYQNFIHKYIEHIWDYDILRIAIMESNPNVNSAYKACSTVRDILTNYQEQTGIIFFGVWGKLKDIRETIISQGSAL